MSSVRISYAIILALYVMASIAQEVVPREASQPAQLRVTLEGNESIKNLVVVFPYNQIKFDDVAAGSTTAYKEAPGGVYSYAAYRFEFDGKLSDQPVNDWVGEIPLKGTRFTYILRFDSNAAPLNHVILVGVVRDPPL